MAGALNLLSYFLRGGTGGCEYLGGALGANPPGDSDIEPAERPPLRLPPLCGYLPLPGGNALEFLPRGGRGGSGFPGGCTWRGEIGGCALGILSFGETSVSLDTASCEFLICKDSVLTSSFNLVCSLTRPFLKYEY